MGKKTDPAIVAMEARNLSRLLANSAFKGPTELGAALDPKRPRGEVHQHLTGARPIPLQAAKSYAKAFGLALIDISPRWAKEMDAGEPVSTAIGRPHERLLVQKIFGLAEKISDDGLKELIVFAECLAQSRPYKPRQRKKAA